MNLRSQLPTQIAGVLKASLHSFAAVRPMHMRGITSEEYTPVTVLFNQTAAVRGTR
jgi:hypothetical protein